MQSDVVSRAVLIVAEISLKFTLAQRSCVFYPPDVVPSAPLQYRRAQMRDRVAVHKSQPMVTWRNLSRRRLDVRMLSSMHVHLNTPLSSARLVPGAFRFLFLTTTASFQKCAACRQPSLMRRPRSRRGRLMCAALRQCLRSVLPHIDGPDPPRPRLSLRYVFCYTS